MTEPKTTITLLPQGAFIIEQKDGQKLKGRFSMYALDRFCEEKKIDNYLVLLQHITMGMKLGDYADLLLIAFEDYFRKDPKQFGKDRTEIMDMLDEMGGIANKDIINLFRHAIGRVADLGPSADTADDEPVNKKKLNEDSTDMNFGKTVISQELM
jgi:hypothetical protein